MSSGFNSPSSSSVAVTLSLGINISPMLTSRSGAFITGYPGFGVLDSSPQSSSFTVFLIWPCLLKFSISH